LHRLKFTRHKVFATKLFNMAIQLSYFDTKLHTDTGIKEEVRNTLAEYLFPEVEFAVGEIYPDATTKQDLLEYEGKTAQFANGRRVYFASDEVREKIYPNMSDGAAYGSLVFTPCKDFQEKQNLRILIVDDETGDSGGILDKEEAKKLVGDCYGRMSPELARDLTGKTNTPFQFRMGIKSQEGNDVYRIAKGTLAPSSQLENLGSPQIERGEDGSTRVKSGYDLVLATSSFKGRKDETKIAPGEYNLTVGIGVKTLAQYGKQSLGTQVLVNYPKGVEADILPELGQKAEELAQIQSDPRALAKYYINKHEKRRELLNRNQENTQQAEPTEDLASFDQVFRLIEELPTQNLATSSDPDVEVDQEQTNELLYLALKACVKHHPQLLEHPKIVDELNKLTQNEWKDLATGRAVEFEAGLAQPSLELEEDEICIPYFPEGAEVIVTRSPLVNSNGVIVLTNKHLPEFMGEQGTVHINPKTAAVHLQADFDGDRLAYQLADKYPTLTAEIKEALAPENRYRDIVKRSKEAYQAETFGEIAISASENKIGLIANNIQKAVALRWETLAIPEQEKPKYLQEMAKGFKKVLSEIEDPKNDLSIPPALGKPFQQKIVEVSQYHPEISEEQIKQKLATIREIFFDIVCETGNELQVAVDGPKSAARPTDAVIKFSEAITGVRDVSWIREKKQDSIYHKRPMKAGNHSPVDLMVRQANEMWNDAFLEAQPTHQFQKLFEKDYTPELETKAKEIRDTYNALVGEAAALKNQAKEEPGPKVIATSSFSGKSIEITNLVKYNHPNAWDSSQLNIRLIQNDNPKLSHKLIAMAQVLDDSGNSTSEWKELGTVSEASRKEHNLRPNISIKEAKVKVELGITSEQIEAKFKQAQDYVAQVRTETAPEDEKKLAAALWHVTHASDQKGYSEYSKASVAFTIFPNPVIEQLSEFQFDELTVSGVHQPTNQWGTELNNKEVQFQVELETRENHPNYGKRVITVEGKQLGPLSEKDFQLPIGTEGTGAIAPSPSTSATATTPGGKNLKITQIKNYDFSSQIFQGERVVLAVSFRDNKAVATIGDRVIGTFDKDARHLLQQADKLHTGAELSVSLTSNPPTTATLKVEPDSLKYPETWRQNKIAREMPLPLQGYRVEDLTKAPSSQKSPSLTTSTPNEKVSQNGQSPYQRAEWERAMVDGTIDSLKKVPEDSNGKRIAPLGENYIAVHNARERTLKILDITGDRGLIYKAEQGKAPSVCQFSPAEKQQFLTSSKTATADTPQLGLG
jgi:hypothetical protein